MGIIYNNILCAQALNIILKRNIFKIYLEGYLCVIIINDILLQIKFEEPKSPFNCYPKEKIRENVETKDLKKLLDDFNI